MPLRQLCSAHHYLRRALHRTPPLLSPMSSSAPARPGGEAAPAEEYDDDDLGGTGGDEDGEETFAEDGQGGSATDRAFDETVGALEEMLMDPSFTEFQSSFLRAHCHEFDASSEENKLVYTTLFDEYQTRMESFIHDYLKRKLGDAFDMESFLSECESRGEEQIAGDAFDVLTSMSDFAAFKELMIAQQQQQQWSTTGNSAPGAASASASSSSSAAPANPQ